MKTIMWNGTVRALSFQDQLLAASLAGCGEISLTGLQVQGLRAEGMTTRDMLQRAKDANVQLVQLDPLARWSAEWVPQNMPAEWHPFFALAPDEFLVTMSELAMPSLTAISTGRIGSRSLAQLTDEFALLCIQAAKHGIRVDLEFLALDWNVADLSTAWQIVRGANQPNSGLVLDIWQFFYTGADWQTLASIPGDRVSSVQLCDATLKVPAHRSALQSCLEDRVPMGQGEYDLMRLLKTLHGMGALGRVGPEYFSNRIDQMAVADIAAISRGSMIDAFDAAGVPHDLGATIDWLPLWLGSEDRAT
jgi:sugar phosphate isomerase/epimerase